MHFAPSPDSNPTASSSLTRRSGTTITRTGIIQRVDVAMAHGEVIAMAIILPWIRCLSWAVNRGIVSASEDTIDSILVQDIGVEEHTNSWSGSRGCVASVVGALLLASGGTDRWVIWLSGGEGLYAHVGICVGRCINGEAAEGGRTGPAWEGLW